MPGVLKVAVIQRHFEFTRHLLEKPLVTAEILAHSPIDAGELMVYACACGDAFLTKCLASGGIP